jgi:L-lactate dehydrogenase complex protein LldF
VGKDPWLPFASSLCGACAEVCPVKIDIPKLLLDLRSDVTAHKKQQGGAVVERLAFRTFAWVMRHPRIYAVGGRLAAAFAPKGGKWIRTAPWFLNVAPVRGWLSQRDLPPAAPKSFRQLWKER